MNYNRISFLLLMRLRLKTKNCNNKNNENQINLTKKKTRNETMYKERNIINQNSAFDGRYKAIAEVIQFDFQKEIFST